jgi:phosphoribosyl-AMP cyclohydrolase
MPSDLIPHGKHAEAFALLRWDADGLIPVIAQQFDSGEILMSAYANQEALALTLKNGFATYFSRSRRGLWVKGATSGYKQRIMAVRSDCDGDSLLYSVDAPGPACHQLRRSCFSTRIDADGSMHCDKPVIT